MESIIANELTTTQRKRLYVILHDAAEPETIDLILNNSEIIEPLLIDIDTEKWTKAQKRFDKAVIGSLDQRAAYRKMIETMVLMYAVNETVEYYELVAPDHEKELILLVRKVVELILNKDII